MIDVLVTINEKLLYYGKLQEEIHQLGETFLIGSISLLETVHLLKGVNP
ncbi:hypothetical protein [Carnobacterium gallinarum]|nr:hypothetical protein [Carnobacterium gallinarum]